MLRLLDRTTDGFALIAAWLFVAAGFMLTYEVVARYVFTAPTIWAQELSQMALVWGTFLAAAALLRHRSHIRISLVIDRLPRRAAERCEVVALLVVGLLGLFVAWHGAGIAFESFERGRTAGTMLDPPSWVLEASVPVGFFLLSLQAAAEGLKLVRGERPAVTQTPQSH